MHWGHKEALLNMPQFPPLRTHRAPELMQKRQLVRYREMGSRECHLLSHQESRGTGDRSIQNSRLLYNFLLPILRAFCPMIPFYTTREGVLHNY